MSSADRMNRSFLTEYNAHDAILKYSTDTAGHGVNYLIEREYGPIYDQAIDECLRTSKKPLRILEYGCGAGMNLIGLVSRLQRRGIAVQDAYGTDFSDALIASAKDEASKYLDSRLAKQVSFHVARNERLRGELAASIGTGADALTGTFDLVFGVNTFRYGHRLRNEQDCANDIARLLRPGGVSVMIDMNDRFPFFRSHLKRTDLPADETQLPTLEEYATPFEKAGLRITKRGNFCWVPHSAGPAMTSVCRALSPILNTVARSRAMRTLVVATKP